MIRAALLLAAVSFVVCPAGAEERATGPAGTPNLAPLPLAVSGRGFRPLDSVRFGEKESETAHRLRVDNSEIRTGGHGRPCRVILPRKPKPAFVGGSLEFTVACDPVAQNYITFKLWGSDVGETTLYLYHDGRQIGSHASDWPPIDKLNWRDPEFAFEGRFFYRTYPLPWHVTRGKRQVTLDLVGKGYLYAYARTFDEAAHVQKQPSRGIYAATVHVDPFYVPPAGEVTGDKRPLGPIRPADGNAGPLEFLKRQTQRQLDGVYRRTPRPLPPEIAAIARAYQSSWAAQYRDPEVLERIVRIVDFHVLAGDHAAQGWFGHGELAEAVFAVLDELDKSGVLERPIDGQSPATRRAKYAEFFRGGIDFRTRPENRGGLANQDIYIITSVYRCNRLLKRLAPERALPEPIALRLVHEAMGIEPYAGRRFHNGYNDRPVTINTAYHHIVGGPIRFSDDWDYHWVTPKGSSKEHGYVWGYGEMAWQTATLAELTGDEAVKRQAIKMIRARAPFRVIGNDRDGYRAVRIEAAIGWRHCWYPGRVEYGDDFLKAAAVLGDPVSVRLAQLYLRHNRVYRAPHESYDWLLVDRVNHFAKVASLPPSEFRLPMRDEMPDFAWADEGIGAVAVKHRGSRVWMSLNWRAAGINNLARIHYTTDTVDRIANVRIRTRFCPSGYALTRPAERCGPFVPGGVALATDGEILPIADGPLPGKADLYECRFGPYLIVMNTTADRSFEAEIPVDLQGSAAIDLIGKEAVRLDTLKVGPARTMVLYTDASAGG